MVLPSRVQLDRVTEQRKTDDLRGSVTSSWDWSFQLIFSLLLAHSIWDIVQKCGKNLPYASVDALTALGSYFLSRLGEK